MHHRQMIQSSLLAQTICIFTRAGLHAHFIHTKLLFLSSVWGWAHNLRTRRKLTRYRLSPRPTLSLFGSSFSPRNQTVPPWGLFIIYFNSRWSLSKVNGNVKTSIGISMLARHYGVQKKANINVIHQRRCDISVVEEELGPQNPKYFLWPVVLIVYLECFGVSFGDVGCKDVCLLWNII